MPVYEYQCHECNKHFEYEHGVNDPHPEKCEECGGELKKVFTPVGIVFKGSGFYINDSRKKENGTVPAPPKECANVPKESPAHACASCGGSSKCPSTDSKS